MGCVEITSVKFYMGVLKKPCSAKTSILQSFNRHFNAKVQFFIPTPVPGLMLMRRWCHAWRPMAFSQSARADWCVDFREAGCCGKGLGLDLNGFVGGGEGANPVPESGSGKVIEFDFSDSHLNSSSRKRPTW